MLQETGKRIFIKNQKKKILKYLFSGRMNKNVLENSILKERDFKKVTISAFINGEPVENDNIFKHIYLKGVKLENVNNTLFYEKIKDKRKR